MKHMDEERLDAFCSIYLENIMGLSPTTIRAHFMVVRRYLRWLEENALDVAKINSSQADVYLDLHGIHQQNNVIISLRYYYRFLKMMELTGGKLDLFEYMSRDKPVQRPYPYYSQQQIETLLAVPDVNSILGLRDRAILQTLYDTGIRNTELRKLQISNLDFAQDYLRVIGKGNKERLLPLTQPLTYWLKRWLQRRHEILSDHNPYLFVSSRNSEGCMSKAILNHIIKKYSSLAGINSEFTVHTLRHCFATHMLENGANILALKQLLGHESINSTQVYLQCCPSYLEGLHRKYHPRADWPTDNTPDDQ